MWSLLIRCIDFLSPFPIIAFKEVFAPISEHHIDAKQGQTSICFIYDFFNVVFG